MVTYLVQTLVAAVAPLEGGGAYAVGVGATICHKATLTQMAVLVVPRIGWVDRMGGYIYEDIRGGVRGCS